MRQIILSVLALIVFATFGAFVSCKKECPTQPAPLAPTHDSLALRATFVSVRWCALTWNNPAVASSHTYLLLRGATDTVFNGIITDTAPHVIDSLLTPNTAYTYTLYRMLNAAPFDTSKLTITTLAITSPSITFKGYGFGEPGSYLRGVWASSQTDVWLCGVIDSSSSPSHLGWTAVHFDGQKFRFYRPGSGSIEGVCGVDSGDVWFCGCDGGTTVEHYDHGIWKFYNLSGDSSYLGHYASQALNDIWASPDKKWVYAVGAAGSILRLNRSTDKWEEMQSNTTYWLRNIVNIGGTLYACGLGPTDGTGTVMVFDGTTWSNYTLSTPADVLDTTKLQGNIMGISGVTQDTIFHTGARIYKHHGTTFDAIQPPHQDIGDMQYMTDIFVQAWNRIVVCGDNDMILLWNGEKWYRPGGLGTQRFERIFSIGDRVFVVGWSPYTAVFGVGK